MAESATDIATLAFAVRCTDGRRGALRAPPAATPGHRHGATQPPIVVTDIVTPVLAGVIFGQSLYGAWIGAVVAIALVGAVIARSLLPAIDPETSAAGG
ncbi:hypothetical protein [Rhizobium leguminosarum]|uniref:hypothetical protein n=1 Tax=Rhizobium leguminosarum TaxID=384 RepID=UPI000A5A6B2A|nr:hypothetical protein [Rhizobium leguminosarum]